MTKSIKTASIQELEQELQRKKAEAAKEIALKESELEIAFKQTAKEINAKLKKAAEFLGEANVLAKKANLPGLVPSFRVFRDIDDVAAAKLEQRLDLIDVDQLEGAMSQAGWSPSSSYC